MNSPIYSKGQKLIIITHGSSTKPDLTGELVTILNFKYTVTTEYIGWYYTITEYPYAFRETALKPPIQLPRVMDILTAIMNKPKELQNAS